MTASFLALMERLPSVQGFIKRILDDIADQRSVVVLLPATIDPDWLWSLLETELLRRDYGVETVELGGISGPVGPAAALGQALHVSWPSTSTSKDVASLLESEGLPNVILLNGIEETDESSQTMWMRFVDQWAQVSQNLPTRLSRYTVLCVIVHPAYLGSMYAESNVLLGVHWWWGFPSALELRLLCRLANGETPEHQAQLRWKEHLLPTLVGGDVGLLESLWDIPVADFARLSSNVLLCADSREWTPEKLREWGVADSVSSAALRTGRPSEPPAGRKLMLWAQGALNATQEHGIELHPAALAVLGWQSEFQHRLWRGQAELLLPILDSIRLEICGYLTRRYGNDWPVRWDMPDHPEEEAAVRDTPLACGWGYLEYLVRNCPALKTERRWLSLITPASQARNAIAHYRTVTCSQYERVIGQYQQFTESTQR